MKSFFTRQKKITVLFIMLLTVSFISCSSDHNDSPEPVGTGDASLKKYSSLDFDFLQDWITHFNSTGKTVSNADREVKLVVSAEIKTIGKVAQLAKKVIDGQSEKAYKENVTADLNLIINKLDDMETKMTASFNAVLSAISDSTLSEAIDSLNEHITIIDNGWAKYLGDYNRFTGEKTADGYLDFASDSNVSEDTLLKETDYFIGFITTDVENHNYANAVTAIRNMMTQPLVSGKFNILDKFVDASSLENIHSFGNSDTAKQELADYMTFYTGLMLYQLKATILMNEYENYLVDSDKVILNDDSYLAYQSDNAQKNNSSLSAALKEQLTPYLNSAERVVSQFNTGDIYRGARIRNSDLYPIVDLLFGIVQGYENSFIFRLAWSGERQDYDTDLSGETVEFTLDNAGGYSRNYEYDAGYSITSVFKLYPKGDASQSFNGGIKRFVFPNVPETDELNFSLQSENRKLTNSNLNSGREYALYYPESVTFNINDLLQANNPLETYDVNINPRNISYTYGAFLCSYDTAYSGISSSSEFSLSFYGHDEALKLDRIVGGSTYYIQYSSSMTTYPVTFSFHPTDENVTDITSGTVAKCKVKSAGFGYDFDSSGYGHGYLALYNKSGKGDHITVHTKNDPITFNVVKINDTPSGDLFSDDKIRHGDILYLEFNNGKSAAGDTGKSDHRLMESTSPQSTDTKNWLYIH